MYLSARVTENECNTPKHVWEDKCNSNWGQLILAVKTFVCHDLISWSQFTQKVTLKNYFLIRSTSWVKVTDKLTTLVLIPIRAFIVCIQSILRFSWRHGAHQELSNSRSLSMSSPESIVSVACWLLCGTFSLSRTLLSWSDLCTCSFIAASTLFIFLGRVTVSSSGWRILW